MKRRDFIACLSSVPVAWPFAAGAQQLARPAIGLLHQSSPEGYAIYLAAFRQGLRETGHTEGQNVAIEYRWAEDNADRLPKLADDLVRRDVAVIVAGGTRAAIAAKAATTAIPIVFTATGFDPIVSSLVASLNRPGGNATGMLEFTELIGKRLEVLHELVPRAAVIGFLVKTGARPDAENSARSASNAIGLQLRVLNVSVREEFDAIFATMAREQIGALLVQNASVFTNSREKLVQLAESYAVPTCYEYREFVMVGGLISYGTSNTDIWRQVGIYTGRILKGEKPADLPVMQPTKFELAINLKAAKALGIMVPTALLARADEVIE